LNEAQMTFADKIKKNFYWVPSSLMIASAILKFVHIPPANSLYVALHVQDKLVYLGVIELVSAIFFLFRPTMLVGFFLICAFWGGVISAGITAQVANYFPIGILLVFGLSLYWRDPSLFIPPKNNE
jgi:hypothetical protein